MNSLYRRPVGRVGGTAHRVVRSEDRGNEEDSSKPGDRDPEPRGVPRRESCVRKWSQPVGENDSSRQLYGT